MLVCKVKDYQQKGNIDSSNKIEVTQFKELYLINPVSSRNYGFSCEYQIPGNIIILVLMHYTKPNWLYQKNKINKRKCYFTQASNIVIYSKPMIPKPIHCYEASIRFLQGIYVALKRGIKMKV